MIWATGLPRRLMRTRSPAAARPTSLLRCALASTRFTFEQIGASAEPTFEALFNADIAKSMLEHFWARLPLTYKSDRLRPEDLLAALAYSGKGTIKIGKLLQQLGCAVLVGSVCQSAASSRHCSPRSWQRYKRELRRQALSRFEPLHMKSFHAAEKKRSAGRFPFKTGIRCMINA